MKGYNPRASVKEAIMRQETSVCTSPFMGLKESLSGVMRDRTGSVTMDLWKYQTTTAAKTAACVSTTRSCQVMNESIHLIR